MAVPVMLEADFSPGSVASPMEPESVWGFRAHRVLNFVAKGAESRYPYRADTVTGS
jgi:hypothetical protein